MSWQNLYHQLDREIREAGSLDSAAFSGKCPLSAEYRDWLWSPMERTGRRGGLTSKGSRLQFARFKRGLSLLPTEVSISRDNIGEFLPTSAYVDY